MTMASMTMSKLAVPTFVGLRAGEVAKPSVLRNARPVQQQPLVCISSLEGVASKVGKVILGVSAGVLLGASTAFAATTVKMGGDDGSLLFSPSSLNISVGETVTFINNAGFPHNVVFDDEDCPSGVDAGALSHEEYLNAPGESFTVTFKEKGTYKFYCEPHQGVGMKGEVTVS